ncbi:flavodoxin family protein [Desulfosporosinus shakirovi]|uniref:flavodoxin family protein n=1 Tax=Desulfosporosinus shakirovi TaxID=2885154 RepID=UPI001E57E8D2|nr:flavodoxin family protein [Desulfosporosinus sp. SRJS8]MCB8818035.1 flavodoxin family protein [Desulfosporosinus sp. SRJS8]
MKYIIVNGSPGFNSFTGEALDVIHKAANQTGKIYNLREMSILPCKGCLACVSNNKCVQKDDWALIDSDLKEAEIIIIGFPTYYGAAFGVNAQTHSFLERWFALRHNGVKLKAKKVIGVITSGGEQAEIAAGKLRIFLEAYHGMELADYISVEGITPCYRCGDGENCPISSVRKKYGKDVKITPSITPSLAKQPEVLEKARQIGINIAQSAYVV